MVVFKRLNQLFCLMLWGLSPDRIWWWPDLILQTDFLGNFDSELPLLICTFFSQILGRVNENHFLFFRAFVSYLSSPFWLIHLPPSPFGIFSFNYLSWWFDLESSGFFSTEGVWCFWAICPLNLLNKFLKEVGDFWQQFLNKGPSISFFPTPSETV